MVVIFKNKTNKDVEIVTIDKTRDLQFKDDRLNVFGQCNHYSTFLYKEWIITNVTFLKDSQLEYDDIILKEMEGHFQILDN